MLKKRSSEDKASVVKLTAFDLAKDDVDDVSFWVLELGRSLATGGRNAL